MGTPMHNVCDLSLRWGFSPGIGQRIRGDRVSRREEGVGGQVHVGPVLPPCPQSLQHREWEAEEVLQGLPG